MIEQPMSDEQVDRLNAVLAMPHGQSAVSASESLLTEAEHSGNTLFLAWSLSTLASHFNMAGETHRSLVPIARLTQLIDADPDRFPSRLQNNALWYMKHVVSILTEDPSNSNEVIERWLGEAEQRLSENGYSLRPVYQARIRLALAQGRFGEADEMARRMVTAERDGLADCVTCEENLFGELRLALGDVEGAMHHWGRVVSGELSGCSWEPARSRSRFIIPAVQGGALDAAVEAHIVGMSTSRRQAGAIVDIAHHIEFCARTHNEARGVEIANDFMLDYDASGADRADYLASLALLARRLVELGFDDVVIRDIGGTPTPAGRLAVDARAAADELLRRFESRDGTDGYRVRRLRERLDATPIVDAQLPLGLSPNIEQLRLANQRSTPESGTDNGARQIAPAADGQSTTPHATEPSTLLQTARALTALVAPGADEAWMRVLPHRESVELSEREGIGLDLLTIGIADWDRRREIAERLRAIGSETAALRVEAEAVARRWWQGDHDGIDEWVRIATERTRPAAAESSDLSDVAYTISWLLRSARRLPPGAVAAHHVDDLAADLDVLDSLPISPFVAAETRLMNVSAGSADEFSALAAPIVQRLIDAADDDLTLRAEAMRMAFTIGSAPGNLDEEYAAVVEATASTQRCRIRTEMAYLDRLTRSDRPADAVWAARRGLSLTQRATLPDAVELQFSFAVQLGRVLSALDRSAEGREVLESYAAVMDPTQVTPSTYVEVLETLAGLHNRHNVTAAAEVRLKLAQFAERFGNAADRFNTAVDAGFALVHAARYNDATAAFARAERDAVELGDEASLTYARYGSASAVEDGAERLSALEALRNEVEPWIAPMRSDPQAFDPPRFINWQNIQAAIFATRLNALPYETDDENDAHVAGRAAAIDEGVVLWRTIDAVAPDRILDSEWQLRNLVWLMSDADQIAEGRELFQRLRGLGVDFGSTQTPWLAERLGAHG